MSEEHEVTRWEQYDRRLGDKKQYEVSLEVAGDFAMWSMPWETGMLRSAPVPSQSAAAGLFSSVAWNRIAMILPTEVRICCDLNTKVIKTNRTVGVKLGKTVQSLYEPLIYVKYQLFGRVILVGEERKNENGKTINMRHFIQGMFNRRLRSGKYYHCPYLGCREMDTTYFGPIRPETKVNEEINMSLPIFMMNLWDKPVDGDLIPEIKLDKEIVKGVLHYD